MHVIIRVYIYVRTNQGAFDSWMCVFIFKLYYFVVVLRLISLSLCISSFPL